MCDSLHVGLRLGERDSGLEAGDSVEAEAGVAIHENRVVPLADGSVDVTLAEAGKAEVEARRNHADDGEVPAIEGEILAQDIWRSTEFALPQAFADERDGGRSALLFRWREGASKDGIHAEQREEAAGDELSVYLLRFALAGEAEGGATSDSHRGEGVVLFLPIEEVGIGDRALIEVRLALVDRNELLRLRERKRIQQHSVHDGEDRGVAGYAEGERRDGYDGEGAALPKDAGTEAKITPEHFEHGKAGAIAVLLSCLLHATEFDERLSPRLLRSHSGAEVIRDVHLEMGLDLVGEVAASLLPAKEAGTSQQPRTQMSQEEPPEGSTGSLPLFLLVSNKKVCEVLLDSNRRCGERLQRVPHWSFAYSAFACFRIGMPPSASFQRVRKS